MYKIRVANNICETCKYGDDDLRQSRRCWSCAIGTVKGIRKRSYSKASDRVLLSRGFLKDKNYYYYERTLETTTKINTKKKKRKKSMTKYQKLEL